MNKIRLLICFVFTLQTMSMWAAQESKEDYEPQGQENVKSYSYLAQELDVICKMYPNVFTSHDYLEENLAYDENEKQDINVEELYFQAANITRKGMKDNFIAALQQYKKPLNHLDDNVFQYVMQHKDDYMYDLVRQWLYEWNAIKDNSGQTQLHYAVIYNHEEIVRMLIDAGVDVNSTDNNGQTPLHKVVIHDNTEIACMLIDAGADINIQDNTDRTPLYVAVDVNSPNVACILIDAGADINCTDNDGQTPLHYAVIFNYEDIVRMLIDAGAYVNSTDIDGHTPLHGVAFFDNTEVASMLINAGADINSKNNDGQTPLCVAVDANSPEVVSMLIDAGADIESKDKYGYTAEHFAHTAEMKVIFTQIQEKLNKARQEKELKSRHSVAQLQQQCIIS